MRALELTGEELKTDVAGLHLHGQRRQCDAAAESLVCADDERDAPPEARGSLAGGGRTGVPEVYVPDRLGAGTRGPGPRRDPSGMVYR
ncbi:hypothetical protein RM844_03025 [Streptomyces sp. DSM 44915]|uniref:Uncharacterized protein n=1 Tax=Streptomyces chisholmiae TaxID=3075540 RepID=A0ABU2JJU6_9ACTN|nr:hypothetical protein [Streptomyces sp. DSM 44915]MDT0265259.1 hypothetical protein [Streptomyces sp. DSM 44915]